MSRFEDDEGLFSCDKQWAVEGTLRQYWFCDLPSGHKGDHVAYEGITGRIRARLAVRPKAVQS